MRAGLIVGLVVYVLLTGHDLVGVIVSALAGLVAWWVESNVWPETDCWMWRCRGGRISYSPFSRNAWMNCPVCAGRGRRRRTLAGGGR